MMTEESLVNYWEKFGLIAFTANQKALITSCTLKSPGDRSKESVLKCCFSFAIKRDNHNM